MPDRSVNYRFTGTFTNLNAGLATAGRNVTELGGKMVALDRNGQQMRAGLTQVGNTAGRAGLLAAGAFVIVEHAAIQFDQAMSNVEATGAATEAQLLQLRDAALQAGQTTRFSATEAAQGVEALLKAGVTAEDVLGGGLKGALDLAAAGELDVADAAEIAATAMTQFKLAGDQVPHLADLLAAGAGKAQGDVSDLSMALKQSGLVAAQMGLSIEQTIGTLTAFASAGLLGSDAGTSFRTMLLRLANPTAESAKLMASLGIAAYDAQGNFVGIENLAGQLQTAFQGQTQATRDAALATIFGSDAIRAANVLYSDGAQGIADWTDKVNDQGYAAQVASTRLDNLGGDLHKLGAALQTAFIGSGEGSQGPLRVLVKDVTSLVNEFNKLPGPVKSASTDLLALTAIVGGGVWFGSKVVRGVADTRLAVQQLGISAGTTAPKLVRLGATGGTILLAAQAMGALVNATLELGNVVNSNDIGRDLEAFTGGGAADDLDTLASALEGVNEAGGGTVNTLFAIPSALTGIKTSFATSKDTIEQFDQALASMVESGNAQQAAEAFQAIRDAAAAHGGVSDDDVVKSFDAYALAVQNADQAARDANGPQTWTSLFEQQVPASLRASSGIDTYAASVTDSAAANEDQVRAIRDSMQAMRDQREEALNAFDAQTQYARAMKDAAEQAKKSSAGIRGNSDEALANRDSLSQLASAWNGLDNQTKNTAGAYKDARQNFIDTAEGMGVGHDAAVALANALLDIPKSRQVKVDVSGADEGKTKVDNLRDALGQLHDRTIHITTVTVGGHHASTVEPHADVHREAADSAGSGVADRLRRAGIDTVSTTAGRLRGDAEAKAAYALEVLAKAADDASDGHKTLKQRLRELQAEVEKDRNAVARARNTRDQIIDDMAAIASSIAGGLKSELYASPTNPWQAQGGVVASTNATLQSDIANAQMFASLEQSLVSRGLHGGALQSLLQQAAQSGNTNLLQQYANASSADLAAYQSSYDIRDQLAAAVGQDSAQDLRGAELHEANHHLRDVKHELHEANRRLSAVEKAIDKADKANRNGHKHTADEAGAANGAGHRGHRRARRT